LFCAERAIWLLDEPFNALDAESRDHFRQAFTRFLAGGGILIAATHDPLQLASTRVLPLRRDMAGVEPERVA
jgi:heme exporter protein A